MKWPHFLVGVTILLFLLGGAAVYAQTDDTDDGTNLCFEGNAWGDGRCDNPDNPTLTDWYWKAGYYFGKVANGELTLCEVPKEFGGFCGEPATPGGGSTGGGSTDGGSTDGGSTDGGTKDPGTIDRGGGGLIP